LINETLAKYSELFMLIAALIYLVSFFFFSWDMASASRSIRKLENELETVNTKELVGASGPSVNEPNDRKQLVSDDMEYTGGIKRPQPILELAILSSPCLPTALPGWLVPLPPLARRWATRSNSLPPVAPLLPWSAFAFYLAK